MTGVSSISSQNGYFTNDRGPRERSQHLGDVPRRWPVYTFGPFTVLPKKRLLYRDGRALDIGSRAFDLLLVLLQAPGEVLAKDLILRSVWPSVYVDEVNVKVQVRSLRKVLGNFADTVICIPGEGYAFTGDVVIT